MISFLPGSYGTSLLRNHVLRGVFAEMENQGFPPIVVEAIRDSVDCNLYFFENKVEIGGMYLVLVSSIVVLIGVYITMTLLSKKRK